MSIGRVVNSVTLVNQNNFADIKRVKIGRGEWNGGDYILVKSWGEDMFDILEDARLRNVRYTMSGLINSDIAFVDVSHRFEAPAHLGDGQKVSIITEPSSYTITSEYAINNFNGCGLHIIIDDRQERPKYFFLAAPATYTRSGNTYTFNAVYPTDVNIAVKNVSRGYTSGNVAYPRAFGLYSRYINYLYENYPSYIPGSADPILVNDGFPFSSDNSGMSETGTSGIGNMQDTSTPIVVDSVRQLFVGQLFRLYRLSVTELSLLSNFLLSADFLDNVKKLFSDPMDYLTSLTAIPTNVFTGTIVHISIGGVTASECTGVLLNNFIADIDCGSIDFVEYFGSFMDYNPYTKVTLYLPFIGYVNINIDAFQNNKLKVKYRIDALTGQCIAFLSNNEGLIASHSGNCAYHIPLRAREYGQMISGLLNVGSNIASGNIIGAAQNVLSGNLKAGGSISSGGSISGNSGILTNRKPYLIIERPKISLPETYPSDIGYISRISAKLGDLSGFTIIEACHLDNIIATEEEKTALEAILKKGIIL